MPMDTLQELNGTPGKATMFFARVEAGASVDEVYENLKARMPHYKITKTSELQEIMAASTPFFKQFLSAIVFTSVVISFSIILLSKRAGRSVPDRLRLPSRDRATLRQTGTWFPMLRAAWPRRRP